MIENFGVKGVQVEELYALDESLLADLQYPLPHCFALTKLKSVLGFLILI